MSNTLAINGGSKAITLDQKTALQWPVLTEEDEQAVLGVMRRNETSLSDEPLKLEKEFAEYLGAKYVLAEINGTSALYAALFVLGIGPGDEVICPSYTYWASAMPAATLGAKVIFCEIYPDSLDLDVEDFKRKITLNTKAVIPVHLWGVPCKMDEIISIAKDNNIAVVEDACHAHGAEYKGKKTGTLGDFGIFSFQASKNLPGGEGGMLITNNRDYLHKATTLGHYRRAADLPEEYSKYQHTCLGFKHRMSPLHAAITRVQLKTLDEKNRIRKDNIEKLLKALEELPGFHIYWPPSYIKRVYYENDVVYREEETGVPIEGLIKMMEAEGAILRRDRYPLLHQQPYFIERGSNPKDLPVTREINEHIMALPTFPGDDGSLVDQYIDAFVKVAGTF
jgi:perosamine synthetase